MKIKNKLLLISTFSALSSFYAYALVKLDPKEISQEVDERKLLGKKVDLEVLDTFEQGDSQYTVFKNVKAYVGKKWSFPTNESDKKNGRTGLREKNISQNNLKNFILDKGAFQIYLDSDNSGEILEKKQTQRSIISQNETTQNYKNKEDKKYNYKVAYNNKTQKLAVITGNAVIKINPEKNINLPSKLFEIVRSYPKLGLYIIRIPGNMKFTEASNKLSNSNKVAEGFKVTEENASIVNIEVIENIKTPL